MQVIVVIMIICSARARQPDTTTDIIATHLASPAGAERQIKFLISSREIFKLITCPLSFAIGTDQTHAVDVNRKAPGMKAETVRSSDPSENI